MNEKMTVFYKKRNFEIDKVAQGEQSLASYARMDIEDAEMVYGFIITDYNPLIMDHFEYYHVVSVENELVVKIKDEFKDMFKQFV